MKCRSFVCILLGIWYILVFVVVEGIWVLFGFVFSGIFGGGLFYFGVVMVRYGDSFVYYICDVFEEGVRVFSFWGEFKVFWCLVRVGICLI